MRPFANQVPVEIGQSLRAFRADHPDAGRAAFLMMKFGQSPAHRNIVAAVEAALSPYGISAVRADGKDYHTSLYYNTLTYLHGCGFGIAVFERIDADDFNPNVSLEVGYMLALGKHVCLLKDKTLRALNTDLAGNLYKSFDTYDPGNSIPPELTRWLKDRGIV